MEYTQQQFDKLPIWAQRVINRLNGTNKQLEAKLSDRSGITETNTFITDGLRKEPLPNNTHIEFCVGNNNTEKVSVYVRNDGLIDINTDSRTGKKMVLRPRASNSFYVDFV